MSEQKILDYLQGKLSSADRVLMEERIKHEPELAAIVHEHRSVFLAIHSSEQKELKERFKQIEKAQKRKSLYVKLSIAASVIVILGVGSMFLFKGSSGSELFAENFEAYPNVVAPITRGISPVSGDNSYFVAYEKRNYSTAIKGFKKSLKKSNDHTIRFYLGMAYLNDGKKDLALKELVKISSEKTGFYPQSLWYSALLYIEKEDFKKGAELLQKLQALKTGYKKEEAQVILEELD